MHILFLWFEFQEKLNEMKRRMLNRLITIILLLSSEKKICSNILMFIIFIVDVQYELFCNVDDIFSKAYNVF